VFLVPRFTTRFDQIDKYSLDITATNANTRA
jgi:hypothetical protein